MVFLSGIHGVGKTYFCNMLMERFGIKSYSASTLITAKKNKFFSADKHITDIDDNQLLLIESISELRLKGREFILDGHFCLLNEHGKITRIPQDTYISLNPDMIVLLTEKPDIIAERRLLRDGVHQDKAEIALFQSAEYQYAKEVASLLHIPLMVSKDSADLANVIEFIERKMIWQGNFY